MSSVYNIAIIGTEAEAAIKFRGEFIKYLVSQGHKVYVFCNDYVPATKQQIRALGGQPVDSPLARAGLNPFKDMLAIIRLAKKLRAVNINLAFCHFVKPVVFGTLSACLARVKRRIAMLEGLGWAFTHFSERAPGRAIVIKQIQLLLYRIVFPFINKLIFLNDDDPTTLSNYVKLPPHHILGGIGVDERFLHFTEPPVNPVTFIFIGRLLFAKGIREFLTAAKIVKQQYPAVRFTVVGYLDPTVPDSLTLTDLQALKANSSIEFTGYVDNVDKYLRQSSVLVLPSYYGEGFSRVIQEAMALGRPVITSDVAGCRQAVIDGSTGFIVPPFSAEAIVEKICYFINAPQEITRMGRQAHCHAKAHFDGKDVAHRLAMFVLE